MSAGDPPPCLDCGKYHFGCCIGDHAGFTPPFTPSPWDPIKDVARGNCPCGKWLVIPKGFTREKPRECHGPCGKEGTCDLNWFWEDGHLVSDKRWEKKTKRPSFDELYMDFARSLSRRSTCERTQVGAVVVSADYQRVLSVGYNGNYRGGPNGCDSVEPGNCGCLHAEDNCLLKMDYNDRSSKILFCTLTPCVMCAKRIINAGIDHFVYAEEYRILDGLNVLKSAGISVRKYER